MKVGDLSVEVEEAEENIFKIKGTVPGCAR